MDKSSSPPEGPAAENTQPTIATITQFTQDEPTSPPPAESAASRTPGYRFSRRLNPTSASSVEAANANSTSTSMRRDEDVAAVALAELGASRTRGSSTSMPTDEAATAVALAISTESDDDTVLPPSAYYTHPQPAYESATGDLLEQLVVTDCFFRKCINCMPQSTPFETAMFEAPRFFYRYYYSKILLGLDLSYKSKPTKSKTKSNKHNVGGSGDPEDDDGGGSSGGDDDDEEDPDNDELHDEEDERRLNDVEYGPVGRQNVFSYTPWATIGIAQALKTLGVVEDFIKRKLSLIKDTMHQHSLGVRTLSAQIAQAKVSSGGLDYLHVIISFLLYLF